jgi:hypothetical protein
MALFPLEANAGTDDSEEDFSPSAKSTRIRVL